MWAYYNIHIFRMSRNESILQGVNSQDSFSCVIVIYNSYFNSLATPVVQVSASYENARSVPRRVELKSHSSEDGDSWDDEDCTDKGTGSLGENSDAWKKGMHKKIRRF